MTNSCLLATFIGAASLYEDLDLASPVRRTLRSEQFCERLPTIVCVRKQEEHYKGGNKEAAGFKRIVPRYLKIQVEEAYKNKCYSDRAFKATKFRRENVPCFRKHISEYLHKLESIRSNEYNMFNIDRETQ